MAGMIKAITGLGNPGANYAQTRHNAGFWFVDALASEYGATFAPHRKSAGLLAEVNWSGQLCRLFKPQNFMNHSGASVAALARYYKLAPDELLVTYDDLDLPPGVARYKYGGGHGGHNGLRDIVNALGSRDFHRLRLGIGHPGHKDAVVSYVLKRPSRADRVAIDGAIEHALDCVRGYVSGQTEQATQYLHTRARADQP